MLQKVRLCLERLDEFNEVYLGLHAYLELMDLYFSSFEDPTLSFETVFENLGYVVMFLRLWKAHLDEHHSKPSQSFITTQAWCDIELSVGAVINLVGAWRDFELCPHAPPDLHTMVRLFALAMLLQCFNCP